MHRCGRPSRRLTVNIDGTVRYNAAFAYLDPVRDRVRVLDRALVDRIEQTEEGWLVHLVRDGEVLTVRAETVVVAGGTYGTPAILQRSGIGDPAWLRVAGIDCVHCT